MLGSIPNADAPIRQTDAQLHGRAHGHARRVRRAARAGGSHSRSARHRPLARNGRPRQGPVHQFEDEVRRVSLEQTMEWDALHRFLEDPDRLLAEFLDG
ncbi:hypothetical protein B5F40_03605 [Gordonibacter sp. An230]|nr:hypothetical protein B5F40_03605 [Gordonibacter sp. An230]